MEKQNPNCHFIGENSQQIPQHEQSSSSTVSPVKRKEKEIVHNISLFKTIRLRKVIRPAATPVELFEFDVEKVEFSDTVYAVQVDVEKEPFGQGVLRAAFKATSCNTNFKDKVWVFKKYSNP